MKNFIYLLLVGLLPLGTISCGSGSNESTVSEDRGVILVEENSATKCEYTYHQNYCLIYIPYASDPLAFEKVGSRASACTEQKGILMFRNANLSTQCGGSGFLMNGKFVNASTNSLRKQSTTLENLKLNYDQARDLWLTKYGGRFKNPSVARSNGERLRKNAGPQLQAGSGANFTRYDERYVVLYNEYLSYERPMKIAESRLNAAKPKSAVH